MSPTAKPPRPEREQAITLIGYRGSGKTVVGQRLAERLGWAFVDTDAEIVKTAGATISQIFERNGEQHFRDLEVEVLDRALSANQTVISAGGGAVLTHKNRKAMSSTSICVWLIAPPEVLLERIGADGSSCSQRPPLTDLSPQDEIEQTLQNRLPVYEATADYVVNTAGRTVDQVVDAILELLGSPAPAREEVR